MESDKLKQMVLEYEERVNDANRAKEEMAIRKRYDCISMIKGKKDVIAKLIDMGTFCVNHGIHLGKKKGDYPEFVSEYIDHKMGFAIKDSYYMIRYKNPSPIMGGTPTAVGYRGGGVCGEDFLVNEYGEIICGDKKKDFIDIAQRFIREIDSLADRFYKYVEKEVTEGSI